ncbi:tetratricopeptide repeat protein [Phytoactinopolyspora limicola]|uniref:tetratricopeptide repeat protein n=1 Tax=Phytoactinopolyspora limicola TaxID=2715536 RepID=UPI00140DBBBB|nr:tetratricopeptide repeat protein [Phytoactinopolyspora limicola]
MYRIDDETLREVLTDPAAAAERVAELAQPPLDDQPGPVGERISLLRMLGRLDEAEALGRHALSLAAKGSRRAVAASLRLAHVLQWQGRFDEADDRFTRALADATRLGDDTLLAFAHQHYGKSLFDQGRAAAAAEQFGAALRLREAVDAPADQLASSRQAIDAARSRRPTIG